MKRKILQSIGDSIIKNLEKADTQDMIDFYYEMGMSFNSFCIDYFDIYLD